MQKKLDSYFKLQEEIHEYFGYRENCEIYSIQDYREVKWYIQGNTLQFIDNEEEYLFEIYLDSPFAKRVYEREDFTFILCNTGCDGNIYFFIVDNQKKLQ